MSRSKVENIHTLMVRSVDCHQQSFGWMSGDDLAEVLPLRSFRLRATCWNYAQCITLIHPAERFTPAPVRTRLLRFETIKSTELAHLGLNLVPCIMHVAHGHMGMQAPRYTRL